jgi:6-phosphogluconolactonase
MKCRVLVGLLVLAGVATWVSCGGYSAPTVTNPGVTGTSFIFVATQGDRLLSPFKIDRSTGKTTTNGTGLPTGTTPSAAIMTPDGNTIFVTNQGSGDISRFAVQADGTLKAVTPNVATSGSNPIAMAMDAAGKFLFVLNQGAPAAPSAGSIDVFSIGQNAALTPASTTANLDNASALAVTPDGKYLYVTEFFANTLLGYSVDANGGLTILPGFPPPSAGIPGGIPIPNTVTPMGLAVTLDDPKNPSSNPIFLYIANANGGAGNISVFEVCDKTGLDCLSPDGSVKEIIGSPFSTSGEPGNMVIVHPTAATPPSGTFLYAADHKQNRVLQFSIAGVTGALTPLSPPAVSTGTSPVWVSARPDGQYVFAANFGSTSLSAFLISDPTVGRLSGAGTATVATGNNPSAVLVK